LLARTFVKIHSNSNLSNGEKIQREKTIRDSVEVIQDGEDNGSTINVMFAMGELNNVLRKSGKTAPGNGQISYYMIKKNLNDESKETLLKLYNKVWEVGCLPKQWKESIIVPICKPGKDPSLAESYRPIALTSHVGKIMEL